MPDSFVAYFLMWRLLSCMQIMALYHTTLILIVVPHFSITCHIFFTEPHIAWQLFHYRIQCEHSLLQDSHGLDKLMNGFNHNNCLSPR